MIQTTFWVERWFVSACLSSLRGWLCLGVATGILNYGILTIMYMFYLRCVAWRGVALRCVALICVILHIQSPWSAAKEKALEQDDHKEEEQQEDNES